MKLETLKDLESVMKLCRKYSMKSIEVDNVKLLLDDVEPAVRAATDLKTEPGPKTVYSEDDILNWSASQVS